MLPTTTLHVTPASVRMRSESREALLREKVEAKLRKRMKNKFDKGEDLFDPDTEEGAKVLAKEMKKYDIKRNSSDDAKRRRRVKKKLENKKNREEAALQRKETEKSSPLLEQMQKEGDMDVDQFKQLMGQLDGKTPYRGAEEAWDENEDEDEEDEYESDDEEKSGDKEDWDRWDKNGRR
ncbi:hypothetical protein SLS62_005472 [Diatrype stigma]|uniref:Uncharacterized protein n=1 Tax=Diatrype stigma TaxID=117547 RepID=A0AAN9V0D9_9PEZI